MVKRHEAVQPRAAASGQQQQQAASSSSGSSAVKHNHQHSLPQPTQLHPHLSALVVELVLPSAKSLARARAGLDAAAWGEPLFSPLVSLLLAIKRIKARMPCASGGIS